MSINAVVIIIISLLARSTFAFNVDVQAPIVKQGRKQSYFGFSATVHRIDNTGLRIIVGAPRNNVSGYVEPGSIFDCPMTSTLGDCSTINIDYAAASGDVTGQWMGVSLASQSTTKEDSRVIACAHLYRDVSAGSSWGRGYCISFANNLDEDMPSEPCSGMPNEKLIKGDIVPEYGLCQAGVSVALDDENNMLIGAPGTSAWRGQLNKNVLQGISLEDDNRWFRSRTDGNETISHAATQYYAYLGMSVKFGRLLNGNLTFIGGAPRSKGHGQVILFEMGTNEQLITKHYLNGEQVGSGFGYDMAVGDFNSDGKDDLVVGAPFYFQHGISGAIYVYISGSLGVTDDTKPHRIESRAMKPAECEQLSCNNARFGFALANAGDLDRDGCQDLVVGAPYEGLGAVYVYHGSRQHLASKVFKFSQRIYASEITRARGLSSFGYSFGDMRGVDVDDNKYPDIVVGAFSSDMVLVMRTRPVVNIETTLTSRPESINPTSVTCSDGQQFNCFNVTVCLRFTAEPSDRFSTPLPVLCRLEAEKFTGSPISRVFFKSQTSTENFFVERSLTLKEQSKREFVCFTETAYVIKNNPDILKSVSFQLKASLTYPSVPVMSEGQPLTNLDQYPVLRQSVPLPFLAVPFVKNCGHDDQCHSRLTLTVAVPNLPQDDRGRYELNVGVIGSSDKAIVSLDINIENTGEDAHATTLTVQLPSTIVYTGSDNEGKRYSCTSISSENTVICSIGNPMTSQKKVSFQLILSPDLTEMSDEEFSSVVITVNTTSNETDLTDNVRTIELAVVYETDLAILGSSDPSSVLCLNDVPENPPNNIEAVGPEVKHVYEIRNTGLLRMPSVHVSISWPYRWRGIQDGGFILYLISLDAENDVHINTCNFDPSIINPDHFKIEDGRRRKRDLINSSTRFRRSDTSRMECGVSDAECVAIDCELTALEPGDSAVITLNARLWNRTITEKFKEEEEVHIHSIARLIIDPQLKIRQTSTANDVHQVRTTVHFEGVVKGLKIWHIVLAVIAGILLLVLFIFLLWKIGFFKRNQPKEYVYHAEVKKQEETEQLATYENVDKPVSADVQ